MRHSWSTCSLPAAKFKKFEDAGIGVLLRAFWWRKLGLKPFGFQSHELEGRQDKRGFTPSKIDKMASRPHPSNTFDTSHEDMIVSSCRKMLMLPYILEGLMPAMIKIVLLRIFASTYHDSMFLFRFRQHDLQLDYYGKRLATCSSDATIKIFDIGPEGQTLSANIAGHEGPVWQVKASFFEEKLKKKCTRLFTSLCEPTKD
jgi:hypothetical protein